MGSLTAQGIRRALKRLLLEVRAWHGAPRAQMSRFFDSETLTRGWIIRRGGFPLAEPRFIVTEPTARIPDFYCCGRFNAWVEVKTLKPLDSEIHRDRIWLELRQRSGQLPGKVRIDASTNYGVDSSWIKKSLKRVSRVIQATPPHELHLQRIIIPIDADFSDDHRFSYSCIESGRLTQRGPRSYSDRYALFPGSDPHDWREVVNLQHRRDSDPERQLMDLVGGAGTAIAFRLSSSDEASHLGSLGPIDATPVRTIDRVRDAVADAASQLKSAQRYSRLPGIVAIYHSNPLEQMDAARLGAALFGDLTLDMTTDGEVRSHRYAGNGALRPDLNTAVSAVRYIGAHESMVLLNPWAAIPIDGRFLGKELVPGLTIS